MDPIISGDILDKAIAGLNSGGISRVTTRTFEKNGVVTVEVDQFNVKMWEIGFVALSGAAIYYVPKWMEILLESPVEALMDAWDRFVTGVKVDSPTVVSSTLGFTPAPDQPQLPGGSSGQPGYGFVPPSY